MGWSPYSLLEGVFVGATTIVFPTGENYTKTPDENSKIQAKSKEAKIEKYKIKTGPLSLKKKKILSVLH